MCKRGVGNFIKEAFKFVIRFVELIKCVNGHTGVPEEQ